MVDRQPKSGDRTEIEFRELLNAIVQFKQQQDKSTQEIMQLKILFRVYDADGDGHIGQDEMVNILRQIARPKLSKLSEDAIEQMVQDMYKEINPRKEGKLRFMEFRELLMKNKTLLK